MPSAVMPRDVLLVQLNKIDLEGWDGSAGRALLEYVRRTIVRPCVRLSGVRGHEAVEVEQSAWTAVWESLATPYLRTTANPTNVLWAAARRAVAGERLASMYLAEERNAWRLATDSNQNGRGGVAPPLSLNQMIEAVGFDAEDTSLGEGPPGILERVVAAMVDEGWPADKAHEAVEAIASQARTSGYRFNVTAGWRRLAEQLDIPPWQVRRLTMLLVGAPGWEGVVQLIARDGTAVLDHDGVRLAIRSTCRRYLGAPCGRNLTPTAGVSPPAVLSDAS
jgi:hypothetical protein